jgi:hypothetical protein
MYKLTTFVFFITIILPACSTPMSMQVLPAVSKQSRLACEQEALIAQEQYLARIKTPTYTSSRSTTWAGGARTDNGKWLFDAAFKTCLLHSQQTRREQP